MLLMEDVKGVEMLTRRDWNGEKQNIIDNLRSFVEIYQKRPFENSGGVGASAAFHLYYFLKELNPDAVIESGIWRGFSTWVIGQSVPKAKIICLDPVIALHEHIAPESYNPFYRHPGAAYSHQDFSSTRFGPFDPEKVCVIFDDHNNKFERLLLARSRGIRHVIFDDNMPYPYTHHTLEMMVKQGGEATLSQIVERYDLFPALWDMVKEGTFCPGLNLPELEDLKEQFPWAETYSWMTYVRLKG
ncbi:hypothetical protein [Azospirillum sp.]|uniref:hypothetical protein n=1 Tax=Azospirillum sp. TaxID=34012 RepID=UPI002D738AF6|nr:hypothetical protein [Azospirillum sp.]HYD70499.1 hypothetical protein [Azospirillum sp.]